MSDQAVTVMAIDPGVQSGWAVATLDPRGYTKSHEMVKAGFVAVGNVRSDHGNYKSEVEAADKLLSVCHRHRCDVVIMEDFRLFPDMDHSSDLDAICPPRIFMAFEALVYVDTMRDEGWLEVIYQMPGEKGVITDERLKRWGLWIPGKGHDRDAMKHLCVYARRMMREEG